MTKIKTNKISPQKKKMINIISLIIFAIFCVVSLILTINIFKLNMLPLKIALIFFLLDIACIIIFGVLILHKKIKWKIKVVCSIILIMLSLGLYFANHYIDRTISFFKNITESNYEVENYYVLVLKSSKIEDKNALLDQKIGYVDNLGTSIEALDKLKSEVVFESVSKKSIFELGNSLLKNELDAILITDYHKAILDEEIEKFSSSVKIIYQFTLEKESIVESNSVDVTKDSFNIYLSGIDTYGAIDSVSRSDVNMIVTVNPKTKQVLLTSIPRDYYVDLSGYQAKDKLTHAGIYGIDCSIGTIENLLDIEINYYARVNFTSLINIVDVLGGIDVYSEYTFDTYGYKFKEGYNHLNGEYALAFSRARYNFVDGDRQRVRNQQAVIQAIVNKALSPAILSKYTSILDALKDSFQTNLSMSEIQKLVKFQIDKMPKWNISSISLNGSDSSNYTYSYGDQLLYVMEPDLNTVKNAKVTIDKVMNGESIVIDNTPTGGLVNGGNDIVVAPTTTTITTITTTTTKPVNDKENNDTDKTDNQDNLTTDDSTPTNPTIDNDDANKPVIDDNNNQDSNLHEDNLENDSNNNDNKKEDDNNESLNNNLENE